MTISTYEGKVMVHFGEIDFFFGKGVVYDYICGATSLNLYYFDFSEPFSLKWVPPCPFRPLCSKKLHMDQGSGHCPMDRGGPKESKNAYFYFSYYFRFSPNIALSTTELNLPHP